MSECFIPTIVGGAKIPTSGTLTTAIAQSGQTSYTIDLTKRYYVVITGAQCYYQTQPHCGVYYVDKGVVTTLKTANQSGNNITSCFLSGTTLYATAGFDLNNYAITSALIPLDS